MWGWAVLEDMGMSGTEGCGDEPEDVGKSSTRGCGNEPEDVGMNGTQGCVDKPEDMEMSSTRGCGNEHEDMGRSSTWGFEDEPENVGMSGTRGGFGGEPEDMGKNGTQGFGDEPEDVGVSSTQGCGVNLRTWAWVVPKDLGIDLRMWGWAVPENEGMNLRTWGWVVPKDVGITPEHLGWAVPNDVGMNLRTWGWTWGCGDERHPRMRGWAGSEDTGMSGTRGHGAEQCPGTEDKWYPSPGRPVGGEVQGAEPTPDFAAWTRHLQCRSRQQPGSRARHRGEWAVHSFFLLVFLPTIKVSQLLACWQGRGVPVSPSSDHCPHFWRPNPPLYSAPQLRCLLVTLSSAAKLLRWPGEEREVWSSHGKTC